MGGSPADGESFSPSISGDGRVVAFASTASLGQAAERRLPGAVQPPVAVFVRDSASGTTTCPSCGGIAGGSGRHVYDPQLSDDGRYVVFTVSHESGSRLVSRRTDVAVHDRASSRTTVITRRANASSTRPRISGNGQFIVFQSLASNLACEKRCAADAVDENLLPDVYLFDRQTETFTRLSRGAEEWWAPSIAPWLDAEARVVIFSSRQPVGPDDPTTDFDLFVQSLDQATEPLGRSPRGRFALRGTSDRYGFNQPPMRPDAQRSWPGPVHSNEKVVIRLALAFTPRSVHASSHPRTHYVDVASRGVDDQLEVRRGRLRATGSPAEREQSGGDHYPKGLAFHGVRPSAASSPARPRPTR